MTMPILVRDDALVPTADMHRAGAVFDDAARLLDAGLSSTPADNNSQQLFRLAHDRRHEGAR
jgi:hypothetical protein